MPGPSLLRLRSKPRTATLSPPDPQVVHMPGEPIGGDALISGASQALGAPQPERMLRPEPKPVPSPPHCTRCGPGGSGAL